MSPEVVEGRTLEAVGKSDGGYSLACPSNDRFLDRSVGGHQGFAGDHYALDRLRDHGSRTLDGGRFLRRMIACASRVADSSWAHSRVGCWGSWYGHSDTVAFSGHRDLQRVVEVVLISGGPLVEVEMVRVLEVLSCVLNSDPEIGVQPGEMASAPGEDILAR